MGYCGDGDTGRRWVPFHRTKVYRYRLTVEVETPEGLRTGSSVIEIAFSETADRAWGPPEASGVNVKLRGEAASIEMPNGQILFALLRTEDQPDAAAFWPKGDLPRDRWPMLVTFRDIADPTSVERVDQNDIAASFGDGISLQKITFRWTGDTVTNVIEARLPWIEQYVNRHFDGSSTILSNPNSPLIARLSSGSFSTEFAR